jgi:Helix-turn-helix domain
MAKLSDVRRRFPPDDAQAYARAYSAAVLAEELGALLYGLRTSANLSEAELASRLGVDEDQVVRAEEGDAELTVAYVDAVVRAVASQVRLTVMTGDLEVVLGAPPPAPPSPAT